MKTWLLLQCLLTTQLREAEASQLNFSKTKLFRRLLDGHFCGKKFFLICRQQQPVVHFNSRGQKTQCLKINKKSASLEFYGHKRARRSPLGYLGRDWLTSLLIWPNETVLVKFKTLWSGEGGSGEECNGKNSNLVYSLFRHTIEEAGGREICGTASSQASAPIVIEAKRGRQQTVKMWQNSTPTNRCLRQLLWPAGK